MKRTDIVGVVLAAGRGSRMSPITDRVPKPLLTVDNETLLALALRRVGGLVGPVAVNAHHLAHQIASAAIALAPDVHVSMEQDKPLGTAGALRHLRDWIDGRAVVVANSDVWLSAPIDDFLHGWEGTRARLLVRDVGRSADFGSLQYLGISTVPAVMAAALDYSPSGLYFALWRDAFAAGQLEFVESAGRSFDCGTPAEFLTANLVASGASSVVAADATVLGSLDRCVILSGAVVGPDEHLVCAVRDRFGNTLTADPAHLLPH
ncbi:NTP transferase domain-containing protein [Nakamurella sp. PAMC28650]|uniref:nucleotidyltransferase family protein n=1 Tax=Nakamurella sp. PAMC28650 TaxID=2762325 RepID=UPI00164EB08E|nr:NTP transferase domain-containing protein [Nakamurella sp. PAMC28650]QNK81050.1 NTP transferase domain-containing protein [Nakamurella sp. PAMC28650]